MLGHAHLGKTSVYLLHLYICKKPTHMMQEHVQLMDAQKIECALLISA